MTPEQERDIAEHKDVAAIAYLWIFSIVVLYRYKSSPFVQHHARQGAWLFFISIPVWLIPKVGHYLEFFVLAGMIIGFLNAAQGQYHDLPLIGALARGTLTLRDLWKTFLALLVHSANTVKRGVMGEGERPSGRAGEGGNSGRKSESSVLQSEQSST